MKNIYLYIGGAFNKKRFIQYRLLELKRKFKKFNVSFYDSWQNSQWNGGRLNIMYERNASFKDIEIYNKLGFGVGITFTNPKITDIYSENENQLLNILNKTNINSVAIANKTLYNHIKSNYKNIKIFKSITTMNNQFNIKELKKHENEYDLICPRYDWVFDKNFYENINVKKYEILVNDCCKLGCPYYKEHYSEVAKFNNVQIDDDPPLEMYDQIFKAHNCKLDTYEHDFITTGFPEKNKSQFSSIHMGKKEINRLYEIGYRHFKFLGKGSMNNNFILQLSTIDKLFEDL